MNIRRVNITDFEQVARLYLQFLNETGMKYDVDRVFQTISLHLNRALVDNPYDGVICYKGEQAVGMFLVFLDWDFHTGEKFVRERVLYVEKQHRHGIVTRRLFDSVQKWAEEQGCTKYIVTPANPANKHALARALVRLGWSIKGYVLEKAV